VNVSSANEATVAIFPRQSIEARSVQIDLNQVELASMSEPARVQFRKCVARYGGDLARESARFEADNRSRSVETPEITASNVAEGDEVLRKPPGIQERPPRSSISVALYAVALVSTLVGGVMGSYLHSVLQVIVFVALAILAVGSAGYLYWRRL
jgi:hypothetical protein